MTGPAVRGLVALFALVTACTATADDVTPTLADTTTTTMPDRLVSTTTAPPTVEDAIEWERIDDPSFDGGRLASVIAAGPGLVAVGTDELPQDAAVWVSPNGTDWEEITSESFAGVADPDGLDGRQFMTDGVDGPNGIVVVGGHERRADRDLDPGVWLSDDGTRWERVTDPDFVATGPGHLNAVTTWNGMYVAVGEGPGPVGTGERRPAVWTSLDGREWEAAGGLALRVDGTIHDVTARGSRLVAVGVTGHVLRPAVWLSDDGVTWDHITSTDRGDALVGSVEIGATERLQDLAMTAVASTPDGFVAAGWTGYPSRAAFWTSPDGLFWSLLGIHPDAERPTTPVTANALTATPSGTVAVGIATLARRLSFAEVWVSTGEHPFAQLERTSNSTATTGPDSPWHMGAMLDVIPFDGGLVAVGFLPYRSVSLPGPFDRQAAWVGTWPTP